MISNAFVPVFRNHVFLQVVFSLLELRIFFLEHDDFCAVRFDMEGRVTGFGNPDWARTHEASSCTSPVVLALIQAGATCVGKTVMDEFAYRCGVWTCLCCWMVISGSVSKKLWSCSKYVCNSWYASLFAFFFISELLEGETGLERRTKIDQAFSLFWCVCNNWANWSHQKFTGH